MVLVPLEPEFGRSSLREETHRFFENNGPTLDQREFGEVFRGKFVCGFGAYERRLIERRLQECGVEKRCGTGRVEVADFSLQLLGQLAKVFPNRSERSTLRHVVLTFCDPNGVEKLLQQLLTDRQRLCGRPVPSDPTDAAAKKRRIESPFQ